MVRFFISILILFFTGCGVSPPSIVRIPTVLVTLAPYYYLVSQIARDTVFIEVFIPPGFNPHLYEPTPQQMAKVFKTVVWFRSEEPFEKKILSTLASADLKIKVVDLLDGLELLSFEEEGGLSEVCGSHEHKCDDSKDKHVWLDPKIAEVQAAVILETLKKLRPDHSSFYQENYENLIKRLNTTDQQIQSLLAPLKKRTILVSHPSLGYFCRHYRLKQLSVECEGKDPRPQQVEKTIMLAEKNDVGSVLIQAQYNNKGATLIAEKLHLPIHLIDPYSPDYINNLMVIAQAIARP